MFDVPLDRVTQLTNLVPKTLGITLDEALQQSAELKQAYQSEPAVRELIDIARKLEGTNRNAGTHAAGVVIANGPLSDYVPLQRVVRKDDAGSRGGEAVVTTQWVMGDLEKVGLLKMDFLGLRTLTLLDKAVRLIEKTRGENIELYELPLDDLETYKLLQRGDAKGVFQFESDGIRDLLKRLRPDNIRDIIAGTALYRPGPLGGGMVDAYINCKHGREKPVYAHPIMEEVLRETHGVMVFQEQVMRILNRLGGIELSSAYACIKAINKKKQEIIDARRVDFLKGARERGVSEATAADIFAKIVYFGGYGFNRSHSCAYAYISYQTAYLKRNYTPEFMAALLSSEIDDSNKRDSMVDHIADARKMGVEVLPPSVNHSDSEFGVHDGKIIFGLTAIKGVGRGSSEEIVRAAPRAAALRTSSISASASMPRSSTMPRSSGSSRRAPWIASATGRNSCRCSPAPFRRRPTGRTTNGSASATCSTPSPPSRRAATARPRKRFRTCRRGRRPTSSSTRRKRWTSTSPVIRWRRTRRSCAASPATPPRR